ncbi:hypothetical protein OH77DRAFT_1419420 [Trametes cingulata]|nr:hypothetical protein OH77DRAFT_1419420 [Trametes cingulata]
MPIGSISEIKQPSNPYQNLSQRALRRCQVNAIKAMIPALDRSQAKAHALPRGAEDIGDGFVLLRALDSCARKLLPSEAQAFYRYFQDAEPDFAAGFPSQDDFEFKARKWARLRLPNALIARSAWKECNKPLSKLRLARCVKFVVSENGPTEVGEVRFFCQVGSQRRPVALISVFGPHDAQLYADSFETVEVREYRGSAALRVVDVKSIKTVVGMIPDEMPDAATYNTDYTHLHTGSRYFVVEKLGLKVGVLAGSDDPEMDIDE